MKNSLSHLKNSVLICFLLTLCLPVFSQLPNSYSFAKSDGTIVGYYAVDNDPHFIRGKQGFLTFYPSDPAYVVSLDPPVAGMVCGGNKLAWTPQRDKISEIVTVSINKTENGNTTTIASRIPISLPIRANQTPKFKFGASQTSLGLNIGTATSFHVSEYVVDDDQDQLTYSWITKPINFPDIGRNDGTFTIPTSFTASGRTSDRAVVGVTDGLSPITFIIDITYNPPIADPVFSVGGLIDLGEYQENDLINYSINAYDAHNKTNQVNITMVGLPYGLTYRDGQLSGNISYDAVPDNTPDNQIETSFAKELTLLAISTQTNRSSQAKLTFKVKNKAKPEAEAKYLEYRQRVDAKTIEYRTEALNKWSIIWADIQKIRRREAVTNSVNQVLQAQGGITAVFGATAPLTTISAGLMLVNGIVSSNLKNKEKQVGTNVQTLTSAVMDIEKKISSFLANYPATPSARQTLLTFNALNKMEIECREIEANYFDYQAALSSINRVIR